MSPDQCAPPSTVAISGLLFAGSVTGVAGMRTVLATPKKPGPSWIHAPGSQFEIAEDRVARAILCNARLARTGAEADARPAAAGFPLCPARGVPLHVADGRRRRPHPRRRRP